MERLFGQIRRTPVTASSGTDDIEAVAAVAGKRIAVTHFCLSTDTAGNVTFKSASTTIGGPLYLPANGGAVDANEFGLLVTNAGEALVISRSTAMAVGGYLNYVLV